MTIIGRERLTPRSFSKYVSRLDEHIMWLTELEEISEPGRSDLKMYGLSGCVGGVERPVEILLVYQLSKTGSDRLLIFLPLGEVSSDVNLEIEAERFEERLRSLEPEMADFIEVRGVESDGKKELMLSYDFETGREGFRHVGIIDEMIGYMVEVLPAAMKLFGNPPG